MKRFLDAVNDLVPNAKFVGDATKIIEWHDFRSQPTEEQIQAKIAELQAAEPMRRLRIERNLLLQQTDWRTTNDYPYADQSAWASYRTQLRNLPESAEPTLDENGNLTNVVWPTPPDDL